MDLFELYEQALKLQERLNTTDGDVDYDQLFNEFGIDMKEIEKEMMENKTKLPLYFKKLNTDVETPSYNYESDSGFDLYSTEEITIPPFGRALIPTGLSFDIKDGYEIQVRSKSGLAINQGLFVLNSPGTVDNGYLGEVKVILFNTNQTEFVVKKGLKVRQADLCPGLNGKWVDLINKEELSSKDRGDNGFGSTGIF